MNRSVINALAVLLLVGGVLIGIWILKPGKPEEAGQPVSASTAKARAAPPRRPSPTPALIRKLSDPSLHVDEQIEAVRALPSDLSEREIAALMELLRRPQPERVGISAWYTLLNEVMEVLRQPRIAWPGFGEAMAELVVDRHIDPVVRDYSAQHLAHWLGDDSRVRFPEDLARGMEAFLTVLRGEREAFESVTGTTLMALCALHDKGIDPGASRAELSTIVTRYASGARPASLSNRISAIQAAGRMGFREALPLIRALATGGEGPPPSIRLSSIAALGYFGDPADRPFLRNLAQSNSRLRFAAKAALTNHER